MKQNHQFHISWSAFVKSGFVWKKVESAPQITKFAKYGCCVTCPEVDICLHRSVPKHEVFYLVSRPTSKMSILSEVKSWTSTIIGAADDILEPNNILIYLHCDPIIYTKSRDVNYTKLRIGIVLKSQESGYYFLRFLML